MAPNVIGAAFVAIKPETVGFGGEVESKMKGIFSGMSGVFAGTAVAAIGVGAALLDIGTKFQTSYNAIARGTGATGDQLNKLKGDFKNVLAGTAGSFQQVQDAIIGVSRATGLTGPPLDTLAKQFVTLGRITKTDVGGNIAAVEPLFAKFNIAAKDQGKALDELFKASQYSGVGITDLAGQVQKGGVILKDFGYSFAGSTALIATFDKAGVNTTAALTGMRKEFALFAKEGKDPQQAMSALVASIKAAPSEAAATGLALKAFGTKAGPELVAAIRAGRLNVDELTKSIASGKDGIMATAAATPTLAGAFAKLKNQVLVALEPIATKLLGLVTIFVDKLIPVARQVIAAVGPIFSDLAAKMAPLGPVLEKIFVQLEPVIRSVFGFLKDNAEPILIAVGVAMATLISPILVVAGGLVYLYNKFQVVRDIVSGVVSFFTDIVVPGFKAVFAEIVKAVAPLIQTFSSRFGEIKTIVMAVVTAVGDVIYVAFRAIKEFWDVFHATILRVLLAAWNQIKLAVETAIRIVSDVIKLVLDLMTGHWSKAWHDLLDILRSVWDLVYGTVKNALSIVGNLLGSLGGIFMRAMGGALDAVVNVGAGILNWFVALPGKVLNAISSMPGKMLTFGREMIQGLIDGIKSVWNGFADHTSFNVPSIDIGPLHVGGGHVGPLLPHFEKGGIVPGLIGRPQLAIVHGGERVLTPQQQANASGGAADVTFAPVMHNYMQPGWDAQQFAGVAMREGLWEMRTRLR